MPQNDPFSSNHFDSWAKSYDRDVREQTRFPFNGYERVLETILKLAEPQAGQAVLDLGTGTGNLAILPPRPLSPMGDEWPETAVNESAAAGSETRQPLRTTCAVACGAAPSILRQPAGSQAGM